MENTMKFESEWHEYSEKDPSTYPPQKGKYLVTIKQGRKHRTIASLTWEGEGIMWIFPVKSITHWAKVEPCME